MDFNNNNKISFSEFKKYINLITDSIKNIYISYDNNNNNNFNNLFSEEDILTLFNKIGKNKEYFDYDDFFYIYENKPEILSWIDYFKNDNKDFLGIMNNYIISIFKIIINFHKEIIKKINIKISNNKNDEKDYENFFENLKNLIIDYINKIKEENKNLKRELKIIKEKNILLQENLKDFNKNNFIYNNELLAIENSSQKFSEYLLTNNSNSSLNDFYNKNYKKNPIINFNNSYSKISKENLENKETMKKKLFCKNYNVNKSCIFENHSSCKKVKKRFSITEK